MGLFSYWCCCSKTTSAVEPDALPRLTEAELREVRAKADALLTPANLPQHAFSIVINCMAIGGLPMNPRISRQLHPKFVDLFNHASTLLSARTFRTYEHFKDQLSVFAIVKNLRVESAAMDIIAVTLWELRTKLAESATRDTIRVSPTRHS